MQNPTCNAKNTKRFRLRREGAHPPPTPTLYVYGQQAGHTRVRRGLLVIYDHLNGYGLTTKILQAPVQRGDQF